MLPSACPLVVSLSSVRPHVSLTLLGFQTNLDGEAQDLDAHPAHVRSRDVPHQFSKLISVLIDLLHSQSACNTKSAAFTFSQTKPSSIFSVHLRQEITRFQTNTRKKCPQFLCLNQLTDV